MNRLLLFRSSNVSAVAIACAVCIAMCSFVGCSDITQFATSSDESYCGQIIPAGFVREGFPPGIRMRFHFDPYKLQQAPGDISTDDSLFVSAPLRPIPQLVHDTLSSLSFGEGAGQSLLYGAQPRDGAIAFVFVSLLESRDVEVRVLRGAPPTESELDDVGATGSVGFGSDLFGVFPLSKKRGTCGF